MNTELKRQTHTNSMRDEFTMHSQFGYPITYLTGFRLILVFLLWDFWIMKQKNKKMHVRLNSGARRDTKNIELANFYSILIHRSFIRNETYNWVDRKSYYVLRQNRILKILWKMELCLPYHCLHKLSPHLCGIEDPPIFVALPQFVFREQTLFLGAVKVKNIF